MPDMPGILNWALEGLDWLRQWAASVPKSLGGGPQR